MLRVMMGALRFWCIASSHFVCEGDRLLCTTDAPPGIDFDITFIICYAPRHKFKFFPKAVNRKSTHESGMQRADGCCEVGISARGEWPGELAVEIRSRRVGSPGNATVIRARGIAILAVPAE